MKELKFKSSALKVIASTLAAMLSVSDSQTPSAWAKENLIVPDGPYAGEKINLSLTPYLVEPLDFFSDACPDNKAVIRKSAQTGFTLLAEAAAGFTIDIEPCALMIVQPTDGALTDFNREKLQKTIDLSPALRKKIAQQSSRSAQGSTTYSKKFPGGTLILGIATSTADLRSKTLKKIIKDEASEYPADLDGQGSPHAMIEARYESFRASGDWKELNISTPVIKGSCYIDEEFHKGDQRYWHMPCPGCGEKFYFKFGKNFVFEREYPYHAYYVTECCGSIVEPHEKNDLVKKGEWIATAPALGKFRSYHFDAMTSPFVPWNLIAQRKVEADQDSSKLKTFENLVLGIAHEVKGDAPDYIKLMERREDYQYGVIPPQGLLLVVGCDVQHSGIWYETVAYGSDKQSWSIEHGFIEGETTDHTQGAFLKLAEIYDKIYPDSFGGHRQIDALSIDAGDGGRANQVYAWTRARHRAFAIKGVPGWRAPAIGTPTQVSINLKGKKIKNGARLWPVGTWSLKAIYYDNLRKEGRKAGAEIDPPGYCHHHDGCDEQYFKQQTAEFLKTIVNRGRSTQVWQETGPNHLLDCRVYAMAMAEHLGLTRMTQDQWAKLSQIRGVTIEAKQPDLIAPDSVKIAATSEVKPSLLVSRKTKGRRMLNRGIS